ncbi:hypothetical protein Tco_0126260, partial [Tanacetum coccineum]
MSPPDPNNTYTKPLSENKILGFIKTLGYDEDPDTKMIAISKMVTTRLHQPWRAILSVLNRQKKTQVGTQLDFQYFRYFGVSFTLPIWTSHH